MDIPLRKLEGAVLTCKEFHGKLEMEFSYPQEGGSQLIVFIDKENDLAKLMKGLVEVFGLAEVTRHVDKAYMERRFPPLVIEYPIATDPSFSQEIDRIRQMFEQSNWLTNRTEIGIYPADSLALLPGGFPPKEVTHETIVDKESISQEKKSWRDRPSLL